MAQAHRAANLSFVHKPLALTEESLAERMEGIAWNNDTQSLLDEHPDAYKDIGEVMDNQKDLVKIEHRLETILNYKGT